MKRKRAVLVVEDERDLAELLCFNLQREGFETRSAGDGASALAEIRKDPPDLIILDRMLPEMSGDEILGTLRKDPEHKKIRVVMLTAKAEEADELVGFAMGADDYVCKPFSMKRLLARVDAVLRRDNGEATDKDIVTVGPFRVDKGRHEVTVDGSPIQFTATEFRLLETLMKAGERVLSRDQLIDTVLGPQVVVTDRTIDVHIAALRRKLGVASAWIQTVRGVGYALRSP